MSPGYEFGGIQSFSTQPSQNVLNINCACLFHTSKIPFIKALCFDLNIQCRYLFYFWRYNVHLLTMILLLRSQKW